MRNTVKHQQQPSTDGELCGDLLRTEGSSSLKSTRASSTGETRGKPIKRRASKLQKNGAYTYARVPPPFISTNQRAEKTKQIDLALSLILSSFRKDTYSTTPLSPFFRLRWSIFYGRRPAAPAELSAEKIEYINRNAAKLKFLSIFFFCTGSSERTTSTNNGSSNKQKRQRELDCR